MWRRLPVVSGLHSNDGVTGPGVPMSWPLSTVVALSIGLTSCQRGSSPEVESQAAPAPSSPLIADAGTPPSAALTVVGRDDGTISLAGVDRWGHRLDVVYESRDFLEKAVPSLERSLTAEQVTQLKAAIKGLPVAR
jgi:hypothetical protein